MGTEDRATQLPPAPLAEEEAPREARLPWVTLLYGTLTVAASAVVWYIREAAGAGGFPISTTADLLGWLGLVVTPPLATCLALVAADRLLRSIPRVLRWTVLAPVFVFCLWTGQMALAAPSGMANRGWSSLLGTLALFSLPHVAGAAAVALAMALTLKCEGGLMWRVPLAAMAGGVVASLIMGVLCYVAGWWPVGVAWSIDPGPLLIAATEAAAVGLAVALGLRHARRAAPPPVEPT